jgi:hypothetical protein
MSIKLKEPNKIKQVKTPKLIKYNYVTINGMVCPHCDKYVDLRISFEKRED